MPRILIVEDEDVIRMALRRLLERNDYEVDEAGSVQEAVEQFERIVTWKMICTNAMVISHICASPPFQCGLECIDFGRRE